MNPQKRREIFRRFEAANPQPTTELEYGTPYELLVAVVLSAQATDKSVNAATKKLFADANTPEKMVALGVPSVEGYIRTIGLFRTKAKNVVALSRMLLEEHCGGDRDTGEEESCKAGHVFSFIGADPNTGWLADSGIVLDDKGFVITGANGRHLLETNCDGVFAVGDVRCGSVKRVAAAVGEGSTVVSAIHAWLARQRAAQDHKAAAE